MASELFRLSKSDLVKAFFMAVISGAVLPVAAMVQNPGFNIFTADWHSLEILALNGALIGFISYLVKNFFSSSDGAVLGRWGGNPGA